MNEENTMNKEVQANAEEDLSATALQPDTPPDGSSKEDQTNAEEDLSATALQPEAPLDGSPLPSAIDSPGDDSGQAPLNRGELEEIVNSAVAQILTGLETAENAPVQRLLSDQERSMRQMFNMMIERIEDPKGLIAYNRQKKFFLDLLRLHDLIGDLEGYEAKNETGSQHRTNYKNIREQLLQILAMNEVVPITTEIGARFNPQHDRVMGTVQTDDASEDGFVDSIIRGGFLCGPYVLRPTEVVVKKRSAGGNADTISE